MYRNFAIGKIKEVIGDIDEAGMDIQMLIKEYSLPNEFPEEVIKEANKDYTDLAKTDNFKGKRFDMRNQKIITVDPIGALDLDDAVSIAINSKGNYELWVHIADVSNYVSEGTLLDKEALLRGTSIYLMDRVIPMLPKILSNGICSLNEKQDRFAISVMMEINKAGECVNSNICKSIINVNKNMSYEQVTKILEKDEKAVKEYKEFDYDINLMSELAHILQQRRKSAGKIDFTSSEAKIILNDNGHAVDIKPYPLHFANHMIEEFMLLANETVAKTYYKLDAPFIYRVEEMPDRDKILALNKVLWTIGGYKIKLNNTDNIAKAINNVLAKAKGKKEEKIISNLLLRTMKIAVYNSKCLPHFGIASNCYCHFTSPIRRYPDLFIHRIITIYLENNNTIPESLKGKFIIKSEIAANVSTEKAERAKKVEWDSVDIKRAEYMKDHIGEEYVGVISNINFVGVQVLLPNTVKGIIKFEDLYEKNFLEFDEENKTLISKKSKQPIFSIGKEINIRVKSVNKLLREINFEKI